MKHFISRRNFLKAAGVTAAASAMAAAVPQASAGWLTGKDAAANETDACARAMARLKDFDCAAFERSVATGEILLPYVLFQMEETESNTQVILTAE